MANQTIGNLSIKLGLAATDFEVGIRSAEKRLNAFAASAASPFDRVRQLGGGVQAMIGTPMATALASAQKFVQTVPGLDKTWGKLLDPSAAMGEVESVFDRTLTLSREAKRLGIAPQFLRSVQLAAGADADAMQGVMQKFQIHLGQLKSGSAESKRLFEHWGMDPAKMKGLGGEDAFKSFLDRYKEIGDHDMQMAFGRAFGGRGATGAQTAMENGTAAVEKYTKRIEEEGIATDALIEKAKALAAVRKEGKVSVEGFWNRASEGGLGDMRIGIEELATKGTRGKGAKDLAGGAWNSWLDLNGWLFGDTKEIQYKGDYSAQAKKADADAAVEKQRQLNESAEEVVEKFEQQARHATLGADAVERQKLAEMKINETYLKRFDAAVKQREAGDATKQLEKLNESLEAQYQTFGKSAEEAKRYELAIKGASGAELDYNRRLTDGLDLMRESKAIREQNVTPLEKAERDQVRLDQLLASGNLDQTSYAREAQRRLGGALSDIERQRGQLSGDVRSAPVLAGTQEFGQLLTDSGRQKDDLGDIKENIKKLAESKTAEESKAKIGDILSLLRAVQRQLGVADAPP